MNPNILPRNPPPAASAGGRACIRPALLLTVLALLLLLPGLNTLRAGEEVATTLADFENAAPGVMGSIAPWYWTEKQKRDWAQYSQLEIVEDPQSGRKSLVITVSPELPWVRDGEPVDLHPLLKTKLDLIAPETDAIRFHVRVAEGEFRLSMSSSSIYFGNSDVYIAPQIVRPQTNLAWQTMEFSFNHNLIRNYRRAGFSARSPVVYLSRWIQEPLTINILRGSAGVLMIDLIELVAKGEGKPFPSFSQDQIQPIHQAAHFETLGDMAKAFTFTHANTDLSGSPVLARPTWAPPTLARVQEAWEGRYSLEARQVGHEEVAFTGIKMLGPEGANAIALKMKANHPDPLNVLCVDFLVYAAPADTRSAFPWDRFKPPDNWSTSPDIAFTYYMSQENTAGVSYGFYHARRFLPRNEWQTVILPLEDFMCAYGQVNCDSWFQNQDPLKSERIIALGFLPHFRQRFGETQVLIDEVSFVSVTSPEQSLSSFWKAAFRVPSAPRNLRVE